MNAEYSLKKNDSLVFLSGKCAHYLQYLYLIYNSTGFHVSSEVLTSLPSHYCTKYWVWFHYHTVKLLLWLIFYEAVFDLYCLMTSTYYTYIHAIFRHLVTPLEKIWCLCYMYCPRQMFCELIMFDVLLLVSDCVTVLLDVWKVIKWTSQLK